MATSGHVVIGRIVRPHGIRGELVVEATGATLGELPPGTPVCVGTNRIATFRHARPHGQRWLVRLGGVDDRDAAEAVRAQEILVPSEQVHRPPAEAEFLVEDLIGCVVVGPDGTRHGTVVEVLAGSPHDLLRLRTETGESLVPMARDWLLEARPGERRLVLDLPAGLLEATHTDE